jgi:hypothetical protein
MVTATCAATSSPINPAISVLDNMKHEIEDLQRRVTALEKAQGASAASQMGKLSRKYPTEAQRAASRANAIKATEARRKKPNDTQQ